MPAPSPVSRFSCTMIGKSSSAICARSMRWSRMASSPRRELPDDPWSIAIHSGASPFALAGEPVLTREDVGPDVAFVADPFLIERGGVWHLFFEALFERGEIGLAPSRDLRAWAFPRGLALREPFHLSYPHVFEHEGEIFMTPESFAAGAVRLYRANPFPREWEHVADLVPGTLADPTPFFFGGRWWMFACPRPQHHDALALFTAPALAGPWSEHPASPIITGDRRDARPAGRVIAAGGALYRFAQDCVPRYGHAVRAFEITTLAPDRYAEGEPRTILGVSGEGWNGRGMHHIDAHQLSSGEWIAAVDGHCSPSGTPQE